MRVLLLSTVLLACALVYVDAYEAPPWACSPPPNSLKPVCPGPARGDSRCDRDGCAADAGCARKECNAVQGSINGTTVVLDAWLSIRGSSCKKTQWTVSECCALCQESPACNAWTYCNSPAGCGSGCVASLHEYKSSEAPMHTISPVTYTQRLNPEHRCTPAGAWPYQTCSLLRVEGNAQPGAPPMVTDAKASAGWVSGIISKPGRQDDQQGEDRPAHARRASPSQAEPATEVQEPLLTRKSRPKIQEEEQRESEAEREQAREMEPERWQRRQHARTSAMADDVREPEYRRRFAADTAAADTDERVMRGHRRPVAPEEDRQHSRTEGFRPGDEGPAHRQVHRSANAAQLRHQRERHMPRDVHPSFAAEQMDAPDRADPRGRPWSGPDSSSKDQMLPETQPENAHHDTHQARLRDTTPSPVGAAAGGVPGGNGPESQQVRKAVANDTPATTDQQLPKVSSTATPAPQAQKFITPKPQLISQPQPQQKLATEDSKSDSTQPQTDSRPSLPQPLAKVADKALAQHPAAVPAAPAAQRPTVAAASPSAPAQPTTPLQPLQEPHARLAAPQTQQQQPQAAANKPAAVAPQQVTQLPEVQKPQEPQRPAAAAAQPSQSPTDKPQEKPKVAPTLAPARAQAPAQASGPAAVPAVTPSGPADAKASSKSITHLSQSQPAGATLQSATPKSDVKATAAAVVVAAAAAAPTAAAAAPQAAQARISAVAPQTNTESDNQPKQQEGAASGVDGTEPSARKRRPAGGASSPQTLVPHSARSTAQQATQQPQQQVQQAVASKSGQWQAAATPAAAAAATAAEHQAASTAAAITPAAQQPSAAATGRSGGVRSSEVHVASASSAVGIASIQARNPNLSGSGIVYQDMTAPGSGGSGSTADSPEIAPAGVNSISFDASQGAGEVEVDGTATEETADDQDDFEDNNNSSNSSKEPAGVDAERSWGGDAVDKSPVLLPFGRPIAVSTDESRILPPKKTAKNAADSSSRRPAGAALVATLAALLLLQQLLL